jgi:hypothetical protein
MKKTKLVTAFYTDIVGFPFFGHESFSRHERYLHSLRTISNTNNEIIIYCNETQKKLLEDYCNEFGLLNVKIKISNLKDYPKSSRMMEIKTKTNLFNFYHEVDWNKLYLLEREYDETYEYIYWIDCGISHPGLFLDRFNPFSEKADGMSKTFENYSYLNLFDDKLIEKINCWVGDNLINICTTMISHDMRYASEILELQFNSNHNSVGGILGGNIKNLKWYFSEFNRLTDKILSKNSILNHEAILTFMESENPEKFKTWEFDTWYHDDYWKKTPVFDTESIKQLRHFVHFFEKVLGY